MEAKIVVGLQFGDEGKGAMVDALSHYYQSGALRRSIVIRFSGGQQAGHTVIRDGIRHVYATYGSGTTVGIPTYLTEHVTFCPSSAFNEYQVLKSKDIKPALIINPLARITTPYDVAENRKSAENIVHGTCGMGVGATHKRHNTTGYKIYAIDLLYPQILMQKLTKLSQYHNHAISNSEIDVFLADCLSIATKIKIADYNYLYGYDILIFEGSQGVMLDMDHGLFPNVTYSNTTSKNAIQICKQLDIANKNISLFYMSRCYQTRHGNGWISNEKDISLLHTEAETNVTNAHQGKFRVGELDYSTLNYASKVDKIYSGEALRHELWFTCCDQRPDFKIDTNLIHGISDFSFTYSPTYEYSSLNP